MPNHFCGTIRSIVLIAGLLGSGCRGALPAAREIVTPEQRQIVYRSPESLPHAPVDSYAAPRTVSNPENGQQELRLSLDESIRIALENSEVVRVLAGDRAVSSGQTIYDPGIANTAIDQSRARFDPTLAVSNTFTKDDTALGRGIDLAPRAAIAGTSTDGYLLDGSLSKTNPLGGTASLGVGVTQSNNNSNLLPLNPQANYFTDISYVQPLMQGGGIAVNTAPVLIAGIETERSFFQFKGSIQELTRGVIEAYWALVFARTDRWARQQQVDQAEFAYKRELSRKERGIGDLGDVAQSRVALTNFRSNLVAAKANVLRREAALLNILGISPTEVGEVVPLTPPFRDRVNFEWPELVGLSEQYRPDLVELKLIIEADLQRVTLAGNDARPRLDAIANYRWDGLTGQTPSGATISTQGGQFADWTMGVNFSVPLGLRQGRASLRQQELVVSRDRANLKQGVHAAVHQVALSVRNLDQYYEQYVAFIDTRSAARDNLLVQQAEFANGRAIFLNVLQAIVDWGNAVSSEAQALSQYNTELANLELQTGTILEAHGVRFMEERRSFVGPLGEKRRVYYPSAITPTDNTPQYPVEDQPAEESFDLTDPLKKIPPGARKELPKQYEATSLAPYQLGPATAFWENVDSLVPERVNWIQTTGALSGVEPEEDPDSRSEDDRDDGSWDGNDDWQLSPDSERIDQHRDPNRTSNTE